MAEAYETFVRELSDLREDEQNLLTLRDLSPGRRKYFAQHVWGVVSRKPDPDGEARPLLVRSMVGNLFPGRWYVRVVEALPQRVPGVPYHNAFEALEQAWGTPKARK